MVTILSPSGVELPDPGELFSRAQYNRNVTKQNDLRVATDKSGLGQVADAGDYTVTSGALASIAVIQNIATFTFKANRRYLIEWDMAAYNNTAGTGCLAQIWSCSVADAANLTTGLTELRGYNLFCTNASQTVKGNPKRRILYAVDTTLQIKGTLANGMTGGGSWFATAGPTYPGQLTITDLGAQY